MHILDLGGGFPGLEGAKVRFEEVTLELGVSCWAFWVGSGGVVKVGIRGSPMCHTLGLVIYLNYVTTY
jgi:hypothetical protein